MIKAKDVINAWKAKYDTEIGYSDPTILVNLNFVLRDVFYLISSTEASLVRKRISIIYNSIPLDLPADFRTVAARECGVFKGNLKQNVSIDGDKLTVYNASGQLDLVYMPEFDDLTSLEDSTGIPRAFLPALVFGLDREIRDSDQDPGMEQNSDMKFNRMLKKALRASRREPSVFKFQ